jgi:hypothetical protein
MNNYTSSTMHKPQVIIISQYSNSAAYNTESHALNPTSLFEHKISKGQLPEISSLQLTYKDLKALSKMQ